MNYLATIKDMAKNKERRTQNLILLLVLLVILLISANYIFKSNEEEKNTSNSTSDKDNIYVNEGTLNSELENKVANILSQISGISDVSVLITYSEDSKKTAIYNTKETQKSDEKTVEKTVAYNEVGSSKEALIESVETPKINGVIVVAKGADNVDLRSKIASAISSITGVPVYKVQVFEKQG